MATKGAQLTQVAEIHYGKDKDAPDEIVPVYDNERLAVKLRAEGGRLAFIIARLGGIGISKEAMPDPSNPGAPLSQEGLQTITDSMLIAQGGLAVDVLQNPIKWDPNVEEPDVWKEDGTLWPYLGGAALKNIPIV